MPLGDPTMTVECDNCHEETDPMGLTLLVGGRSWDDRNIRPRLKKWGWRVDGESTVCPECLADLANQ